MFSMMQVQICQSIEMTTIDICNQFRSNFTDVLSNFLVFQMQNKLFSRGLLMHNNNYLNLKNFKIKTK